MSDEFIKIEFDERKLNQLVALSNKIGSELGRKGVAKAIASVSKEVEKNMKSRINTKSGWRTIPGDPEDKRIYQKRTGRLIRAIKIKNVLKYRPMFWKSFIHVKRGTTKDDPTGAFWAHMLEFGHHVTFKKNGPRVGYSPPRSFARAGAEATSSTAKGLFEAEINKALDKLWKKL